MARIIPDQAQPELFRCTESFAVQIDGISTVFTAGAEVLGTDPILKTHGQFFEAAAARLLRQHVVEHTTAEPGAEPRHIVAPHAASSREHEK
jgi:hypothetical protein